MNNRIFDFGVYKGQSISDIIKKDPQYITWCLNNVSKKRFKLNKEEKELYGRYIGESGSSQATKD